MTFALPNPLLVLAAAAIMTPAIAAGQNPAGHGRAPSQSDFTMVVSADRAVQVRYPKPLLVCRNRDGENPDVWSPEDCTADIPVCDSSGHSGNVLLCLAYPVVDFHGTELQAAAFAVSRIDNFSASECTQKWPQTNTSEIHPQKIGGLKFQTAKARESVHSHVADQRIYRIYHKAACYELDINLVIALDSAFAAEDAPRKLSPADRERIADTLEQALAGFRFLK